MTKLQLILIKFVLILSFFIHDIKAFTYGAPPRCYNPNGRAGRCISIYECNSILNILQSRISAALTFARKSECSSNGQGRRPFVCCTSDTGFRERTDFSGQRIIFPEDPDDVTTSTVANTRNPDVGLLQEELFPKPPACGPVFVGNKIYGGEETELGEFPWLANLEYIKKSTGDLVSVCAGNIINRRYLITAAHCIKGEIEIKIGKLVSIRVGDHNTQSPVDCNSFGCVDPFQRLSVEKIIVHQEYGSYNGYHNHNDIALVRTAKDIIFSYTVAPICLPDAVPQMPQLKSGLKLSVAGWGHNGTAKYSSEKRKVDLPYVEAENCPIHIAPEQLCAGGEFLKDSCTGDSGGGLVLLARDCWVMEGIVSYGRGCGLERPGVYTRVRSYIQWIHDNVVP